VPCQSPEVKPRIILVSELWDVIFPHALNDNQAMVVIVQYFDESADERREKVYAVAGYFGNQFDWLTFEGGWEKLLSEYRLDYFKASECETLTGQFARYRKNPDDLTLPLDADEKAKRTEIKTAFVDIAIKSPIVGFGAAVLMEDFNELCAQNSQAARSLGKHPYFICAHAAMATAGHITTTVNHDQGTSHLLAFVFDENKEVCSSFLAEYHEFQRKNPYAAEYMASATFASELRFKPLQVADLLVYEARKLLLNKTYEPNRATRIALKRISPNVQALYRFDRQALEWIIKETSVGVPLNQVLVKRFEGNLNYTMTMTFDLSTD